MLIVWMARHVDRARLPANRTVVQFDFRDPKGRSRAELGGAMRAGNLALSGPRALQRGFGQWFTWSAFAPASREAAERHAMASRLADPERVRIAD